MRILRSLALAALLAATTQVLAQAMGDDAGTALVTIENTSPQVISPPVAIVHEADYAAFEVGAAAPPELALLAEDGDASELAVVARVTAGVHGVVVAPGPLPPGERVTLEVPVSGDAPYVTILGMLVTTNDAFVHVTVDTREMASMAGGMDADGDMGAAGDMGADGDMAMTGDAMAMSGHAPPSDGIVRVYDAGSERDSEACAHIPGPPCGSAGVRATEGSEGHVALDGGILGIGDLDPREFDWSHPVLDVTITPSG